MIDREIEELLLEAEENGGRIHPEESDPYLFEES